MHSTLGIIIRYILHVQLSASKTKTVYKNKAENKKKLSGIALLTNGGVVSTILLGQAAVTASCVSFGPAFARPPRNCRPGC